RATTELAPLNHNPGGMRQRFSAPLVLLMALSASIFLVGCLNLANLQLARLNTRAHELGVRMALGASRGRILRQVVLEDVLIVLAGCASAFVMGRLATSILVRWASNHNSRITLDLHTSLPIAVLGVALMPALAFEYVARHTGQPLASALHHVGLFRRHAGALGDRRRRHGSRARPLRPRGHAPVPVCW